MNYSCPEGARLQSAWYDQVARREKKEWTDLALIDYRNHRHSCPACHAIMLDPIGNIPIPVGRVSVYEEVR